MAAWMAIRCEGAVEDESERTSTCVSERPQSATPASGVRQVAR